MDDAQLLETYERLSQIIRVARKGKAKPGKAKKVSCNSETILLASREPEITNLATLAAALDVSTTTVWGRLMADEDLHRVVTARLRQNREAARAEAKAR